MLRAVARLSLVALIAGPALVVTASPCGACSCAPQTPKQLLRHADAAFVGTVTAQQPIDQTTTVQTFEVRSVFKGTLGPTVQVIDPIGSGGGDTCGILYGGGAVAVILHRQGDGWTTDVCSRITVAQLMTVGPSPVHPTPEPSGPAPPTTSGEAPTADAAGGLGWQAVVVGLLVGVAAIALALSFGGHRDRAKTPETTDPPADGPADPPGPSG